MPVIIYSEVNIASRNICKYIIEKYGFEKINKIEWIKDIDGIKTRIIKVKENVIGFSFKEKVEYIVVPSTHKSESKTKSLSVHVPGNWSSADLGGREKTLNVCYASKMKTLLLNIKNLVEGRNFDWVVTLEVDHHGPTPPDIHLESPIMFVEIGSTESEWNNEKAISIIGDAIMLSIPDKTQYPAVLGFGGGHYAAKFNKFELDKDKEKKKCAMSHILPKYCFDGFKENANEMFKQALEKNVEKIEKALIDWKGLKSDQRRLIIDLCEKNNLKWEKV